MPSASPPPFSFDAPPSGPTLSIDGKALRLGCFGCSSALFLAGCLALVVIVWGFLIPNWRINNRYRPTTCEVLDTKVESTMFAGRDGGQQECYRPSIKVRYQAEGRQIETWSYDGSSNYDPHRDSQQAIADSFKVGATCPIWYDPDRPDRSVLVRNDGSTAWAFIILPFGLFFASGFGILLVLFVPSKPSTPPAPTAPAPGHAHAAPPTVPLDPDKPGPIVFLTTPSRFDPSTLHDPIALKTDWHLVHNQNAMANFRVRKLALVDPDRQQYRMTPSAMIMPLIISTLGVLLLLAFVSSLRARNVRPNAALVLFLGLGLLGLGGWLFRNFMTPVAFDRRMGFYWKGRKSPDFTASTNTLADAAPLHEIHALQLLRGRNPGANSASEYAELNLVLKNGNRLNVINESSAFHHVLRKEAVTLAEFLHKPLWDAT